MTPAELFRIIHNSDIREVLRRYHPRYVVVAINGAGEIAEIERFKYIPTPIEQGVFFSKHKGCVFFIDEAETCPTLEVLQQKIDKSVEVLKNREANAHLRGKGLVGDTYYGGRYKGE